VFAESIVRPLLVLHAVMAIVLLGSVGHLGYESLWYLLGRARNVWLGTVHARVGFVLYVANFLLGLAVYPTFRVRVRHDYFDAHLPWATNLFDTKEIFAAFGLAAFTALFAMSFAVRPRDESDRKMLPIFAGLGLLVSAISIFAALVGIILVTYRGPA
jgi:hypothetical protein